MLRLLAYLRQRLGGKGMRMNRWLVDRRVVLRLGSRGLASLIAGSFVGCAVRVQVKVGWVGKYLCR